MAEICNCSESELSQYELSSVETVCIAGCPASPSHELEIFNKMPNLTHLDIVSYAILSDLFNCDADDTWFFNNTCISESTLKVYGMSETGVVAQVPKGNRKGAV